MSGIIWHINVMADGGIFLSDRNDDNCLSIRCDKSTVSKDNLFSANKVILQMTEEQLISFKSEFCIFIDSLLGGKNNDERD